MMQMNKEAEWLLKEKYDGAESDAYRADLKRLEEGEPVDYVIGFSKFLGCTIDLSKRTLIPRTETEYWVEKAILEIKETFGEKPIRCLDVFSGSGCIGIAVLSKLPNTTMDFADIEENALTQIQINTEINNIDSSRYAIYKSDVFEGLPPDKKYDVIFANPPYIKDPKRVDKSVLDYEPHTALFSPEDGYLHIKKTIEGAKKLLTPGGCLYLEFDDIQKEALEEFLTKEGTTEYVCNKDQFGLWRWVRICHK